MSSNHGQHNLAEDPCVTFVPAGDVIAFGGRSRSIHFWSLTTNQLTEKRPTQGDICALSYRNTGELAVFCNHGGGGIMAYHGATATLWDRAGNKINSVRIFGQHVDNASISRNGEFITAAGADGGQQNWLRVWKWNAIATGRK